MLILSHLKPGDTLGRYEILMPVARGGMAAVWAARLVGTRGFQKLVAIKTMLPEIGDDPAFEAMFLDEARLASRIRHPHAVEIVELGDENGLLYIVMEWVDGETMFTINKRLKAAGGAMPLPILLRIASSTCAGLHAAHELRDDRGQLVDLVHRDISPQNVMVSFDGIVKILDFGVAKAAGRLHETRVAGQLKGKIPYLSPEQITTGRLDRRSDIFSLGALLYASISGYHPFRGPNDAKTIDNICNLAPVPLRELAPDVPSELEAVIDRALAKDPSDRWPDCASLQRAIDRIASTLGPSVTDGDVGRFVRDTLGDVVQERRKKLAAAIQHADARLAAPGNAGAQRDDGRRARQPVRAVAPLRGGTPLPATFAGILPVALDDAPLPAPHATETPVSNVAVIPSSPPALVTPARSRRHRRWGLYLFVALLLLVGGAAAAARLGLLPLPPQARELLELPQIQELRERLRSLAPGDAR